MIFLDASYFVALVNETDVHHAQAKEIARKIDSGDYGVPCTTDHILDESISVALRKWGKEKAQYVGKTILNTTHLIITDEHLVLDAWKLFQKTEQKFSFTDCVNIATCTTFDVDCIATFDEEFRKTDIEVIGAPL